MNMPDYAVNHSIKSCLQYITIDIGSLHSKAIV